MLAGVGCFSEDRTPAKPLWSEVIVFWEALLRRKDRCPEEIASSDEAGTHRKWGCAREFNSGERMLAGGGGMVRRPNSGEAAVVGGDRLFGGSPPAEGPLPGGNRQLR